MLWPGSDTAQLLQARNEIIRAKRQIGLRMMVRLLFLLYGTRRSRHVIRALHDALP